MTVIYQITATVPQDLVTDYEKYMLEKHIPDLLGTGFFSQAFFTRADNNRYQIQYHAFNQKALDDYWQTQASRLREDFHTHFPVGITLSRENWQVLKVF
jgi:hypothetical protein